MSNISFSNLLFRRPVFARVFWADVLAQFGEVSIWVAYPIFVYEVTGDASHSGGALAGEILAFGLMNQVAGAIADRTDPKRVMLRATVARQFILLGLLFYQGGLSFYLGAAVLLGLAGAFFVPCRAALVRRLLEGEELESAVAFSGTAAFMLRTFVPAVVGILLAWWSPRTALVIDLVAYLGVQVLLRPAWVKAPELRCAEESRSGWLEGWRHLLATRCLRVMLFYDCQLTYLAMSGVATTLALLEDELGLPARYNGWMMAANGAAGVVGTRWARRFSTCSATFALLTLMLGLSQLSVLGVEGLRGLLVAWALRGFAIGVLVVKLEQLLARESPPETMGRIQAAWNTACCLSAFTGAISAPWLIGMVGARASFGLLGVLTLVLAVYTAARRALDQ